MSDPEATSQADKSIPLPSHPPDQLERLRSVRPPNDPYDFRLNDDKLQLYLRNGFVVSERMGSRSYTDLYHRIYVRDLPVFVTADLLLHVSWTFLREDTLKAANAQLVDYYHRTYSASVFGT